MTLLSFFVSMVLLQTPSPGAPSVTVEKVAFPSRDGKSTIKGYVFRSPATAGKAPAIVMLHGRSGAYSSLADGKYDETTLAKRHKAWGEFWARRSYVALMVDDFGPLGYPQGFGRFTYNDRPAELDEVAVRPLHAYGALRYLSERPDVDGRRVGLMGWSNGGSATLAAMADDKPGDMTKIGFKAAVSMYPGCGLKNRFKRDGYRPYAPVRVFMGSADQEVSPETCSTLVERSRKLGGDIAIEVYRGAEHSFDTPTASRQKIEANAAAKDRAEAAIAAFFDARLKN